MHKVLQQLALPLFMGFMLYSCTKIDTTSLGSDLIPVVDNINTFDTVLEVIANNYIPEDSTRLNTADSHVAGGIMNDPLFGTTKASLFFEVKPATYPFLFANRDSLIDLDSAVMVFNYNGYYGDSAYPLNLKLYEVNKKMINDTSASPSYTLIPDLQPNRVRFWGEKTMEARKFKDTIALKQGEKLYANVVNQLRIPLNRLYAKALFFQDTAGNGAFKNDSLFKEFLPGFALEAGGNPQALFYFQMSSGTKIEFYYRNRITAGVDTLVASFGLTYLSGHAVKFERNRAGAEVANWQTPNVSKGLSQIYLQATPGTAADISIPGLNGLSNRIIHRAELRVTQMEPNPSGLSQLVTPQGLYLDAKDSTGVFRGIPYDLSPFSPYFCYPSSGPDFGYFGGFRNSESVGNDILSVYRFNIARYIQAHVSRNEKLYPLRLSAPFYLYYKYCVNQSTAYPQQVFPFVTSNATINRIGYGRVKVAGGTQQVDPKIRMQLRIIYSKL